MVSERDALILENVGLVRAMAFGRWRRSDIVSAGMVALVEWATRYLDEDHTELRQRVAFRKFVRPRIREAMTNERYGFARPLSGPSQKNRALRREWVAGTEAVSDGELTWSYCQQDVLLDAKRGLERFWSSLSGSDLDVARAIFQDPSEPDYAEILRRLGMTHGRVSRARARINDIISGLSS